MFQSPWIRFARVKCFVSPFPGLVSIPVDKVRACSKLLRYGNLLRTFQSPWIRFARKWELLECNLRHVSIPVDKVRAAHLGVLSTVSGRVSIPVDKVRAEKGLYASTPTECFNPRG